jgi:hypothetical protein
MVCRWCPEGDLNPHDRLRSADFKSAVSADFTIRALHAILNQQVAGGMNNSLRLVKRIEIAVHLAVAQNGLNVLAGLRIGNGLHEFGDVFVVVA